MATVTVTPGYGWSSGEIVTPAKMNLAASPTVALAPNTIVDADVSSSAAIAGTKIAPAFGSQNVVTAVNVTAGKLIPTGTSAAGSGVYLPATNAIGVTTDGVERIRVAADGNVGIFNSTPAHRLDVNGGINTNASFRFEGVPVVRGRQTGWGSPSGTATRTAFATSSVSLEALAQRVKALIDDLRSHGLIGN
jgi:hypothetical protein